MSRVGPLFAALVVCGSFAALGAGGCRRPSPPSTGPKTDQATRGLVAYGNYCAGCHDPDADGERTSPALSGDGALPKTAAKDGKRTTSFETAKDVFDYSKASMPQLSPGSLSDEQYWEIVASLMRQNGLKWSGDLGPENAATLALPNR